MDSLITNYLSGLQLGELQTFKNMGIIPLSTSMNGGPEYATLKEALDQKLIAITEIDQAGSVPELKVINTSEQFVLLFDGEELVGAKQNRVLNTSILLKASSEMSLPVSCTERGRWRYTSAEFSHSATMMPYRSRATKAHTVSESLRAGRGHTTDQLHVWRDIEQIHRETGTLSTTGALRDAYTAKTEELNEYLQTFEYAAHQRGSLVFVNGEVVGFDAVSRAAAYETIHPQLVKSYAMDALLQRTEEADGASVSKAKAFLQETMKCKESRFDAVGQGYDYRFEGSRIVGSALVYDKTVIHIAFFKADENEQEIHMTGYLQRRHFRRGGRS